MFKQWVNGFVVVMLAFGFSGCATVGKEKELEIQGLRNQLSALEAQVQSKDEEILSLKDELAEGVKSEKEISVPAAREGRKKLKAAPEAKSRPTIKQIQAALENAGYEPGSIDGAMGRRTREAIKAFQRANNLHADGKVGKNTWALLKEYLHTKLK